MSSERQQAVPEGYSLERPSRPEMTHLKESDPTLHRAVEDVIGALRSDLLPYGTQEAIFHAMNAAVQRNLISEASGLDEGILVTFKQQLSLVDSILRRTFNEDGTLASGQESLGMDPKDVLNLSLNVSKMMVKELPKVYSMDRVQRMEQALLKVMADCFTREQQEAFLVELEKQKVAV